jgi:hypothetical protein
LSDVLTAAPFTAASMRNPRADPGPGVNDATGKACGRPSRRVGLPSILRHSAAIIAFCGAASIEPSPAHASAAQPDDTLRAGFEHPPASARPRVWWHWMNGNISRDGITKDLAWMKRIGLGGVQNFDAGLAVPQVVDTRVPYMTPEWKRLFRFAAGLAQREGLEFAIASSPGWSETGGPWVAPADGMKKLVWSEIAIEGGAPFAGSIPAPPAVAGPYQTLPRPAVAGGREHERLPPAYTEQALDLYRDAGVLAYRSVDATPAPSPAIVMANGAPIDGVELRDDDLSTGIALPLAMGGQPGTVEFRFTRPVTVRSVSMFIAGVNPNRAGGGPRPRLERQDDAGAWQTIVEIPLSMVPSTASFPTVTARNFRLVLARGTAPDLSGFVPAPGIDMAGLGGIGGARTQPRLTRFMLGSGPRINAFEFKAGFAVADDYYALGGAAPQDERGIDPGSVIDLTRAMDADGILRWTPPPGHWKILRFGYSLTGRMNAPASAEATGLEVDKFDAAAVETYLGHYLGTYREAVGGPLAQKGVGALLNDSIETGPSNWTPRVLEQFERLRGYDPRPWLPALTGELVGSRRQSDGFLFDFRRTLGDLLASEHYGTLARVAHGQGMTLYGESLEATRDILGDDIEMRRFADIPMGALWAFPKGRPPQPKYVADLRGAASAAHIYGHDIVAAESLTTIVNPWAHAPGDLRPMIDAIFANGVNRPVIHTSVHQPVDRAPGVSLGAFGQYFTRLETWAEMAAPWIDYISRTSFMLQQGRNVADVAYFYGEEMPVAEMGLRRGFTDAPTRYGYDLLPPDALLNNLKVEDGTVVASGGARYRAIYLGGTSERMTLRVLQRLAALAGDGATIIGEPPQASPSLADDPEAYQKLVATLWPEHGHATIGKGRIIRDHAIEPTLEALGIVPDFDTSAPGLTFVHRQRVDADIYFVVNALDEPRKIEARFRVSGRAPELWHADDATVEPVPYRIENGETIVALEMGGSDSNMIVFRKPARPGDSPRARAAPMPVAAVEGPWRVDFQAGRGAPRKTTLPRLVSLSDNSDPAIRYFSGVSTYRSTFSVPRAPRGVRTWLDLGKVGDVAEVRVNGKRVGTAWKTPYRLDISAGVHPGRNQIEVRVANLWVNRLVGDAQPGAKRIAYTTLPTYTAKAPLRPSGLIGPVTILRSTEETAGSITPIGG